MNKLFLLCLLSILILYTQCQREGTCKNAKESTEAPCSGLVVSDSNKVTYKCVMIDNEGKCDEVLKCNLCIQGAPGETGKTQIESCLKLADDDNNKICTKKTDSTCNEISPPKCNNGTLGE